MSHTYPLSRQRQRKLNETISEYINSLGSSDGVDGSQEAEFGNINRLGSSEEDDRTQNAESQFKKNLKRLAKCSSFKNGKKKDEYATVLHKVVTMYEDEGCTHESAQDCTRECDQKRAQGRVLQYIIKEYPELLYCHRDRSVSFCGQTPLHIAISKVNKKLVELLLDAAKNDKQKADGIKELLSQNATGLRFRNNVMMGQLPLSIAALTGNEDIVKLLLDQGETYVYQENSVDDNLCHSLLKYVSIFPEKEDTAIEMMKFINKEKKGCCKQLFLMVNENKETPLILAAKLGQVEIIKHIIEEGYCSSDDSSGLFDVRLYDMTEIDHQLKEYRKQEDDKVLKGHLKSSAVRAPPTETDNGAPSVFDLIFHHSYKTSLRFMQIRPIQWMIKKKWRHYRYFLYSFCIFHIIVMSVLTAAAVERVTSQRTVTINQGLREPFPAYYAIIMTIVSLLYIWVGVFKIVQIFRRKFQVTHKPFLNPYANAIFQALFLLFALCIISDFGASWSANYNNMLLITAVVIGWYLLLFFLRANSIFSFFTSLIQRILLQDITRFAPIITLQLVAFSTAMFMLLHNPNNQNTEGYSNWGDMLLLTFKSFLGVGDIPISDSSHPVWLAIVFVIFIIMTTILMLNALIAILSSTCTDLLNHFTPDMHLHLQQLAVILFFEGLLPDCVTHCFARKVTREVKVVTYDRFIKKKRHMKRNLMRIDVLEDEDEIGGATEENNLYKMVRRLHAKYAGNDTTSQSTLNSQPNGTQSLQRSTKSTKSTMAKTVEHLDLKRHLDIYHHPQVGQSQTI